VIKITTMKGEKHEMLKAQWMEIIKRHSGSGQSIRSWCENNNVSKGKFYYWQRIIREETLIKAGTLALTGQNQFVELTQSKIESGLVSNNQGSCAILRSNGSEVEVLNGADPNTLALILNLIGK